MAHILFDGDIRRHPALRSLLWQWGVTVGSLPQEIWSLDQVTVEDCDAVILLCGDPTPDRPPQGAMPDGAETKGVAAAAAPLLVIGQGSVPPDPWVVIPDPGPCGSRLKAALQSCQERARVLRGDRGSRRDLAQFRDFLSHELRSPLTAIKTALAALKVDEAVAANTSGMLDIAQRNLGRLEQTVEWSQDLMGLAEAPPVGDLQPVSLETLAAVFPERLDVRLDAARSAGDVLTDVGLLGRLAIQMERVLSFACPGCSPSFRLESDPDTGEGRFVATVLTSGRQEGAAPVSRAGRLSDATDAAGWNRVEFEHLARMLVSPELLQALGVRIRIAADSRGVAEFSASLPACTEVDSHLQVLP